MRFLMAILGILAMLVILSGPVTALAMTAPCDEMAMAEDMPPCEPAAKTCAGPCLAVSKCHSPCSSVMPFVGAEPGDIVSPLLAGNLRVADIKHPPGADSPVDGPPPRI